MCRDGRSCTVRNGVRGPACHGHQHRKRVSMRLRCPATAHPRHWMRTNETESKGVLCTHILMSIAGARLPDSSKKDDVLR